MTRYSCRAVYRDYPEISRRWEDCSRRGYPVRRSQLTIGQLYAPMFTKESWAGVSIQRDIAYGSDVLENGRQGPGLLYRLDQGQYCALRRRSQQHRTVRPFGRRHRSGGIDRFSEGMAIGTPDQQLTGPLLQWIKALMTNG
jgi:hypothetical protein